MNAKSLGTLLRDWRIEKDLTQSELGRAAGLSRKIIGAIEQGDRTLDNVEVVKICRALGRNLEEMVLHWSKSSLKELRDVEREILGAQGTKLSEESNSGAPEAATNGSITDKFTQIGALFGQVIDLSQAELIRKLRLEMNTSGAASPPPPAPQRPRSRVSRRGRSGRSPA